MKVRIKVNERIEEFEIMELENVYEIKSYTHVRDLSSLCGICGIILRPVFNSSFKSVLVIMGSISEMMTVTSMYSSNKADIWDLTWLGDRNFYVGETRAIDNFIRTYRRSAV